MSNFIGTWTDHNSETINVTGHDWVVYSMKFDNDRPDFQAFSQKDKITANFTDREGVLTGELSDKVISWSNDTKWTKQ
ncbi:MAG: hypothetical protein MJK04_36680 [Psychrosphaera sp.]|nr:hypothetical protein [Psychrosphaera sp.]